MRNNGRHSPDWRRFAAFFLIRRCRLVVIVIVVIVCVCVSFGGVCVVWH